MTSAAAAAPQPLPPTASTTTTSTTITAAPAPAPAPAAPATASTKTTTTAETQGPDKQEYSDDTVFREFRPDQGIVGCRLFELGNSGFRTTSFLNTLIFGTPKPSSFHTQHKHHHRANRR